MLGPRTVVATFPQLGQARLNLAFPSVEQTDPDMYALDLLAEILGGRGEFDIGGGCAGFEAIVQRGYVRGRYAGVCDGVV